MSTTDYLAIYGAFLSTIVALWNVYRSRSKVRIRLIFAAEERDGKSQFGLGISIQNPSSYPVHIASVSFLYKYRDYSFREFIFYMIKFKRWPRNFGWCHYSLAMCDIDTCCPVSIEPGKSHWIFVHDKIMNDILGQAISKNVIVLTQDFLWRNKVSKKFMYDVKIK